MNNQSDWVKWHRAYDDPESRLSRRLAVVQAFLRRAIDERPGPLRIVSMCAGEGRDVIGVLDGHPRRDEIRATLVELDPRNAAIARASAKSAGLRVAVVEADAGVTDSYAGAVPAEIVLACGVFGNIRDRDIKRTVEHLPSFCAPGAAVLWTRAHERDIVERTRGWLAEFGFEEQAFEAPGDQTFRVGMAHLATPPRPLEPGTKLFEFFR